MHTKEVVYKCDKCTYTTYSQSHMSRHKRIHSNKKLFICKICKASFNRKIFLNNHFAKHEQLKEYCSFYQCQYCAYKSTFLANVKKHENDKHTKSVKYYCDKCEYWCTRKSTLKRHKYTHETDKPFKCFLCEYQAGESATLRNHINKNHK